MSLWKQLALILGLIAAATGLSARFLPASHPFFQRVGVLAPLERLGVAAQPPEADASPAKGGRPGAGGGPATVIALDATPQVMRDIVSAIGTARAGARTSGWCSAGQAVRAGFVLGFWEG